MSAGGGANLLRSYLAALSFKVDATSYNAFNRALATADKGALGLGRSAIWASAAVLGAVAIIANGLDKLYFASLRSGESASNLELWGFGAGRAGIAADKARGMIENLAISLQTDPGLKGVFLALMRGEEIAESTTGQMDQLVKKLRSMGPLAGSMFGDMFGLNWGDISAMSKTAGERAKAQAEAAKFAKDIGLDIDAAAKAAERFNAAAAGLVENFRLLGMKFVEAVGPWFEDKIKELNGLLKDIGVFIQNAKGMPKEGESGYEPPQEWLWKGFKDIFTPERSWIMRNLDGAGVALGRNAWEQKNPEDRAYRLSEEAMQQALSMPPIQIIVNKAGPDTTVDVLGPLNPEYVPGSAKPVAQ